MVVRIRAASVNPLDWHMMSGTPYFLRMQAGLRPRDQRLGVDYAGVVETVGSQVTAFRTGDQVFGSRTGAFAEFISVKSTGAVVAMPANVTFEEAAAVPVAGLTALQSLRSLRAGQTVLVNGAGGGVGTYAVQLAVARGAIVTGVCSGWNVDLVRGLGAKDVVDYTEADFTTMGEQYDLVLDNVGTRSLRDRRRIIAPRGQLVSVSGPKTNLLLGPVTEMIRLAVAARLGRIPGRTMLTRMTADDLGTMRDLLAAGTVTSVIDRRYPLAETLQAIQYVGEGHARGKVVITV
jgi:NADPH:quinone reductase-like Zn-dependent oxidoreductase